MDKASPAPRTDGALTAAIGWALIVVVCMVLYAALLIPETPLGSLGRKLVDRMHMSWGLIALVLVIWRLVLIARDGAPVSGVIAGALRDMSIAFYLAVLVLCIVGPIRGWGEGYVVPFFNLFALPNLVPAIYEVRVVAGYLHSAVSFFVTGLVPAGIVGAVVLSRRAGVPFYRLFPY